MNARVFHTSDWHLGRQIGRHRRDAEFDRVIEEIIDIATDFGPDLIVHSGDLFDGSRPGLDDLIRAAHALRRLGHIAPVLVVAGNHDTANVLRFLNLVLTDLGTRTPEQIRVRFATDARPDGLLIAEYPTARSELTMRVGALPYLHPNRFAYEFGDPTAVTATYAQRMRVVQADVYRRLTAGRGPRDALVFAAHLFVEGATPSYTEKAISLSHDYAVAGEALPAVDYGALGHIHKPQRVDSVGFPAHYAGSPLQLDFGEAHDSKSITLVEIRPGREPLITLEPLKAGRRLVQLTGTLDEITLGAPRVGDAWVKAVIDVEGAIPALSTSLAALLPRATIVDIIERHPATTAAVLDRSAAAEEVPSTEDLLREYLPSRNVNGPALDRVMATLAQMQSEPDLVDPSPCCEETLLRAAIDGQDLDKISHSDLLTTPESHREGVQR